MWHLNELVTYVTLMYFMIWIDERLYILVKISTSANAGFTKNWQTNSRQTVSVNSHVE